MKHKILLPTIISLFIFQSQAQGTFDLNEYKYRVNLYRYKTYGFSANNQSNAQKTNNWYSPVRNYSGYNDNGFNSYSNTNLNLSVNGYSFINTERMQQVVSYSVGLGGTNNSSQNMTNGKRDQARWENGYSFYPQVSILRRIYSGLKFSELSTSVSFQNGGSNYKFSDKYYPGQSSHINASPTIQFQVGFGTGRLEMIGDAAFANFWLEDMKNKKVIAEYDAETLNNLAKTVTKVRNTRIIDYRFRAIGQVKMYDSFFRNSGLLKNPDIDYYTSLYDNYLYANNFQRYSGKRKTWFGRGQADARFYHSSDYSNYIYYNYISNRYNTSRNLNISAGVGFRIEKEKAISLHKQKSNFTEIYLFAKSEYYAYNDRYIDSMIQQYNGTSLNQSVNAMVTRGISSGYYYSTRSYIQYGINYSILFSYINDVKNHEMKLLNITPMINGYVNYYYWFSPNVQLNISGNIVAKENFYQAEDSIYSSRIHSQSIISITPYFNVSLNYTVY